MDNSIAGNIKKRDVYSIATLLAQSDDTSYGRTKHLAIVIYFSGEFDRQINKIDIGSSFFSGQLPNQIASCHDALLFLEGRSIL